MLSGLYGRLHQVKRCPCCDSQTSRVIDRKFFHSFSECEKCGVLFRFPRETKEWMDKFYQNSYSEPGLTTELPSDEELQKLVDTNFRNSQKDFSYHIEILHALGLSENSRLLDYGANWGYATFQFRKAGFTADAFELSETRAQYGRKLGIDISTTFVLNASYDAVYSSHVLEHVPNPIETIKMQLDSVKAGGLVIAHTPNGSSACRTSNYKAFHRSWGLVHPVLLTQEFIEKNFSGCSFYVSSYDDPQILKEWDQASRYVGKTDDSSLFFVLRKAA